MAEKNCIVGEPINGTPKEDGWYWLKSSKHNCPIETFGGYAMTIMSDDSNWTISLYIKYYPEAKFWKLNGPKNDDN